MEYARHAISVAPKIAAAGSRKEMRVTARPSLADKMTATSSVRNGSEAATTSLLASLGRKQTLGQWQEWAESGH